MALGDTPILTVRNRAELRDWLATNHASETRRWLATYKRPHPDHLPYPALVEELLCWGWIDSLPKALDAERTMVLITRRKPNSAWSGVNKAHVARARASGAMTPAGEAAIAVAVANGMWNFLTDVDALILPADLEAALTPEARAVWEGYPPSTKRATLEWLKMAKTAPIRAARLRDIAESAAQGVRPSIFRR